MLTELSLTALDVEIQFLKWHIIDIFALTFEILTSVAVNYTK
jgi:hypothetical protein